MIIVYPDANALNGNPYLQGKAQQLLGELKTIGGELRISPVVVAELRRQEMDDVAEVEQSVETVVRKRSRGHPEKMRKISGQVSSSLNLLRAEIHDRLSETFAADHVVIDSYPRVEVDVLVKRELERRRPFLEVEVHGTTQSIGFRDYIIWEGVRAVANDLNIDDTLIFISNDKGFLNDDKSGLHTDLESDLRDDGSNDGRVMQAQTLQQAIIRIEQIKTKITKERADVSNKIISLALTLIGKSVGWQYDPREGGVVESEYGDLDLPRELENAHIVAVDLIGGPIVSDSSPHRASQAVELSITGEMYSSDWYILENSADLEFWGNLNERYVEVGAVRRVAVEATINLEPASKEPELILRLLTFGESSESDPF
ncbi:DUF4935 domain-containing protein [Rathayibacter sp. VKM Ac-2856]|uniref:PIN domain-containing protein n=1 Tax=unclassified Rathayibacter TaxID=2609250 RepID=UPI00156720FC|nr:DUF4935 domain-containing protein [Rathayibacter sp. VKM Ac-2858]NQX22107.1 DUF4935 domain-containing protein [Rathayibacter sp. VKM Ac-2856]